MGAQQHEALQQSGEAASDGGKHPEEEGSGKDDYSRNLLGGNGNGCIEDDVASEHSRSTQAQEQESPACRAGGEHREQSLHDSTVTAELLHGNTIRRQVSLALLRGA
jgi:hypothetical protein